MHKSNFLAFLLIMQNSECVFKKLLTYLDLFNLYNRARSTLMKSWEKPKTIIQSRQSRLTRGSYNMLHNRHDKAFSCFRYNDNVKWFGKTNVCSLIKYRFFKIVLFRTKKTKQ